MRSFLLALTLLSLNCYGQSDWFSFDIPPLDTTNQAFFPEFDQGPIGDNDFVSIDAMGNFVVGGQAVRFWGTPCSRNESASLNKDKFPALIKELKKNGVNIFRFHLWDSEFFNPGTSIFGAGPGTRSLDADALDRIDRLIALMKENGIYAYMDLLCDRHYTAEDGVDNLEAVRSSAKIVNYFDPQLIALQKEFARQLLTHVNPYTGKALVDEPAMAVIDIVNEGWFLHSARCGQLKPISEGGLLSDYHFEMLTDQWNEFLLDKYGSVSQAKEAWGIEPGNRMELVRNGDFENGWDNWACWGPGTFSWQIQDLDTWINGQWAFELTTSGPSTNPWDCQLKSLDPFFRNSSYELRFRAKANIAGEVIETTVQLGVDPWTVFASESFTLTTQWTEYESSFTISKDAGDQPYLHFNLGGVDSRVWIDDVSIIEKVSGEERFELPDYSAVVNGNQQKKLDLGAFYLAIQEDYFSEMSSYLKDELGVKIPLTGSNYIIGIPDVYANRNTDFIDNHGYWDHWNSPEPVSMIPQEGFYNPVLGLFSGLRVPGMPLAVSEYNYQAPNSFAYEALFFLAAYGSLHDANMLIVHQLEYTPTWDLWNHGFNSYQQIAFRALQPTMAYAYRNRLIGRAQDSVVISFSPDDARDLSILQNPWEKNLYPADYPFQLAYKHRMLTSFDQATPYNRALYPENPSGPYLSDTEEISWDPDGLLSVNTPQFCAFVGKLDQYAGTSLDSVRLTAGENSAGFTLLALDEKELGLSERMLMTITTQMKNTGMVTDGYNTVVPGSKPRILEATSLSFELSTQHEDIRVVWLDERGQLSEKSQIFQNNGSGVIPITIDTHSDPGVWFALLANEPEPGIEVTFRVDMQNETVDPTGVFITGSFDSWESPAKMEAEGSIYSATLELPAGSSVEYLFMNGTETEELSGSCASGEKAARSILVPEQDSSLSLVCYASCEACPTATGAYPEETAIRVYPNPSEGLFTIHAASTEQDLELSIFNIAGVLVHREFNEKKERHLMDLGHLEAGIYYLVTRGADRSSVHKLLLVPE